MSGFLDTNLVVRYLTGDPPHLAERAARIIDHTQDLLLTDGVIAEIAYVLMSVYRVSRAVVMDHLIDFIRKRNITVHERDKTQAIQALMLCRPSGRVSVVDALLWSTARSSPPHRVYTLDDRFPGEGIENISAGME
jgi:predicted nucleic acid-binding protein